MVGRPTSLSVQAISCQASAKTGGNTDSGVEAIFAYDIPIWFSDPTTTVAGTEPASDSDISWRRYLSASGIALVSLVICLGCVMAGVRLHANTLFQKQLATAARNRKMALEAEEVDLYGTEKLARPLPSLVNTLAQITPTKSKITPPKAAVTSFHVSPSTPGHPSSTLRSRHSSQKQTKQLRRIGDRSDYATTSPLPQAVPSLSWSSYLSGKMSSLLGRQEMVAVPTQKQKRVEPISASPSQLLSPPAHWKGPVNDEEANNNNSLHAERSAAAISSAAVLFQESEEDALSSHAELESFNQEFDMIMSKGYMQADREDRDRA